MKKFCGRVEAMNLQILMYLLTKCSTRIKIILLHDAKNTYHIINIIVVSKWFISVLFVYSFQVDTFSITFLVLVFVDVVNSLFQAGNSSLQRQGEDYWSSSESSKKGKDSSLTVPCETRALDVKPASRCEKFDWDLHRSLKVLSKFGWEALCTCKSSIAICFIACGILKRPCFYYRVMILSCCLPVSYLEYLRMIYDWCICLSPWSEIIQSLN